MAKQRRPYHHGDLRSAMLTAAGPMLERVGTEALSMRELAREVGVSNNAPRRHFPSKQALLDDLALLGFKKLGAVLNRALSNGSQNFEDRLLHLAQANIRFALKNRALMQLMFLAKQRSDAPPDLLEASYKALSAGPATIVFGQTSGAVVAGDPEKLALTVFAAVEGLISLSVEGRLGGVPLDQLAEEIVLQIVVGLRPRA